MLLVYSEEPIILTDLKKKGHLSPENISECFPYFCITSVEESYGVLLQDVCGSLGIDQVWSFSKSLFELVGRWRGSFIRDPGDPFHIAASNFMN